MLCEGRLLSMTYGEMEEMDSLPSQKTFHFAGGPPKGSLTPTTSRPAPLACHSPLKEAGGTEGLRAAVDLVISPLSTSHLQGVHARRQMSAEMEIPAQTHSDCGNSPFVVPSFCQSICQNYSDLHIAGEQVLPLSANDADLRVCAEVQPVRPFLQSCDVPPAVEDSPPGQRGLQNLLRRGSNHWKQASGRNPSFMFQGHEGPFSNSLLNHYLEQKVLDLYQQYMMENMAREGAPGTHGDAGVICPLLGSELVLTSLDQITQQLSREGNMEAGLAKDMVLSCLLRVASDLQSGEISTPFLQISNEASRELLTESTQE
uniref:TLR adaptor interacting with endolysosomal SLC15A4 n=1 Tax=Fundulus heteroclitus TaxID=8078 RepID=A0A3Q2QN76_FUNHE